MEQAAAVEQLLRRHLGVHDAGAGGHPLGRAVRDHAAAAVRVEVPQPTVEHVRDGLEPAVRVVRRALGLARRVLDGAHVIEHQERVGPRQIDPRGSAPHLEALALEERRRVGDLHDGARRRVLGGVESDQGAWRRLA